MPRGATGEPRLGRVREPHSSPAPCRWPSPWPCWAPGGGPRARRPDPLVVGPGGRRRSPRPCSAGSSWCSHVAPVAVAGHYLLSAVLVWNAVVLHHRAAEPEADSPARGPPRRCSSCRSRARRAGRPGARHRHARHRQRPPRRRRGGRPASRSRCARSRASTASPCGLSWSSWSIVLATGVDRGDAAPEVRRAGPLLVGASLVQGGLGYLQYFTGVPEVPRRPRTCWARCSCGSPCSASTWRSREPLPEPAPTDGGRAPGPAPRVSRS